MGFRRMLLRYFIWILCWNIQRECLVYDEDNGRNTNYAPNLLVNEDKGQDVVSVLALVKTVIGIIDGQRLSQGQV